MTTTPAPSTGAATLSGNATGPFPTGFAYGAPGDVRVWIDTPAGRGAVLTRAVDYTLSGANPTVDGGTITLSVGVVPPEGWVAGTRLVWARRTVKRQALSLPDTEGHKPRATEAALDKSMRLHEEAAEGLDRALTVPIGETAQELPPAEARRGRALAWADTPDAPPIAAPTTGAAVASDLFRAAVARAGAEAASVLALTAQGDAAAKAELSLSGSTAAQAYLDQIIALAASVAADAPYATEAAGRAAVANGAPFWVSTPDGLALHFRIDAGTVTTPSLVLPSLAKVSDTLKAFEGNFELAPQVNLANPNQTDVSLDAFVEQLWRVWNGPGGLGVLSDPDETNLSTLGVTRRLPVTAGQEYTISLHGAPQDIRFYFTGSPFLGFYKANGDTHSVVTAGFARGAGDRSVTFTVPAGAEAVALNLQNTTGKMTLPLMAATMNAMMLNVGATAADIVPWVAPGTTALNPAILPAAPTRPITVAVQAGYAFVRTALQQSAVDVVWRVLVREIPAYAPANQPATTGCVDFVGARIISRATPAAETIAAYNRSTVVWSQGGDERTPVRINGHYIGGGHGINGFEITTAGGHGKTTADHGSTWTDAVGKVWILFKVVSATKLLVVPDNTGAIDKWVIAGALSGTTLTHQAGATHTGAVNFVDAAFSMATPILQNLSVTLWLDDVEVPTDVDGLYQGQAFRIEDLWDVPNAARLLAWLKANVGATTYTSGDIGVQLAVSDAYVWNRWGAMTLHRTEEVREAFRRSPGGGGDPGDYNGFLQMQRPSRTVDVPYAGPSASIWFYAANMGLVGGKTWKDVVDVTANAAFKELVRAASDDPADPTGHFAFIGKDAGAVPVCGMLAGFARVPGTLGAPATRAQSVSVCAALSAAEKLYLYGVDVAAGDAQEGDVLTAVAYRAWFDPAQDPALTIPAVVVTVGSRHHVVIASHQVQNTRWVRLPRELIGLPVRTLKADAGVTLHSGVVQARGAMMSFSAAYGDVVLEVG